MKISAFLFWITVSLVWAQKPILLSFYYTADSTTETYSQIPTKFYGHENLQSLLT